jgi:type VI secretion system protein ImpL
VLHEVTITPPSPPAAAPAGQTVTASELVKLLVPAASAAMPGLGGSIEAHFKPLRDYLGGSAGAPIDQALAAINGVQQSLAQLAAASPGAAPVAGTDPVLTLRAVASQAPQPVQRWLLSVATGGTTLRTGGARQQAAATFNGEGGPGAPCQQAVRGRFPFVAASAADVPLDDFTRLFSPNGLIGSFFNAQLRPFVDTTASVWRTQPTAGVAAPVSPPELAQFQRAAVIRQMFFPTGGDTPAVRLEITPVELDAGSKQVTLELGATSINYAHGSARPAQITWPAQGNGSARVVFDAATSDDNGTDSGVDGGGIEAAGPWALFRLVQQGSPRQDGGPDAYRVTFRQGKHKAVFQLRMGSVVNPLQTGALQAFQCPVLR